MDELEACNTDPSNRAYPVPARIPTLAPPFLISEPTGRPAPPGRLSCPGAPTRLDSPMRDAPPTPVTAAIALGSNLGDRQGALASAVRSLALTPGVEVLRVSSMLETAPVGPGDQGDYLNAALTASVTLSAHELLLRLHTIERAHGRDRAATQRWGPRTLDLDLLLYGDHIIDMPGLRMPHPRLGERAFVLQPLSQIAPDLVVPTRGLTIAQLLRRLPTPERQSPDAWAPGLA